MLQIIEYKFDKQWIIKIKIFFSVSIVNMTSLVCKKSYLESYCFAFFYRTDHIVFEIFRSFLSGNQIQTLRISFEESFLVEETHKRIM